MVSAAEARRWYSVEEFAHLTGKTPAAVRKACQRGGLRTRKTGSRWRIAAGNLDAGRR